MTDKKIWLTYAWTDNQDQDVDYVIQELRKTGLEVGFDRAELLAGRRLWDQIDQHISRSDLDAWAIFVTKNSLESEPCQEELAYALDRSLRVKGASFPLIGIFPEALDRTIIPSAIATRLYVNLNDPNWAQSVVGGVQGANPDSEAVEVSPLAHKFHRFNDKVVLEVWPRAGVFAPFHVGIPQAEKDKFASIMTGTKGHVTGTGIAATNSGDTPEYHYAGLPNGITPSQPAHIFFNSLPSTLVLTGRLNGQDVNFGFTAT